MNQTRQGMGMKMENPGGNPGMRPSMQPGMGGQVDVTLKMRLSVTDFVLIRALVFLALYFTWKPL